MGDARGLVAGVGLGLTLGLGAGYLLFGGRAPDPELAAGPAGRAAAPVATGSASADLRASATDGSNTDDGADAGGAPGSAADPTPGSVALAGDGTPNTAGTGEIHGRVTTEDGTPLADVVVRAGAYQSHQDSGDWRPGDPAPSTGDLDASARRVLAKLRATHLRQVEARTGADGGYRLEGLSTGQHWLAAYLDGFAVLPIHVQANLQRGHGSLIYGAPPGYVSQAAPGMRVDFIARPIAAVRVAVTMPDGSAPATATLQVTGTRRDGGHWSPSEPALHVTLGRYEVTASVQVPNATDHDRREYRSEAVPLEVRAGQPTPSLAIALVERTVLAGRLKGLPSNANQYAFVRALPLAGDGPRDHAAILQAPHAGWAQGSNPVYRIENLEPGAYLIGVGLHGQDVIQTTQAVTLQRGLNLADFRVSGATEAVRLQVLATGPDGRPLGDLQFWVTGGKQGQQNPIGIERAEDGGYVLVFFQGAVDPAPGGEAGGTAPGPVQLHGLSPVYGERQVVVSSPAERVTLAFEAAAHLEVRAPGCRGSVFEGHCGVSLLSPEEVAALDAEQPRRARRWGWQNYYTFDRDDRARIGPLSPGAYTAVLWVAPWGDRVSAGTAIEATRHPIALGSGTQVVTLALPLVHALTVVVEGAQEGENIGLNPIDAGPDDNFHGETWIGVDAQGRGMIHGLLAGRYRLERQGPDGTEQSMAVTVPVAAPVRFVPDPRDRMRVTVVTEDGALGRAGLQSGDHITALDGKPFRDPVEFARLLRASPAERVTLTARRGGEVVTAAIERAVLADGLVGGTGLGGTLTPTVGDE